MSEQRFKRKLTTFLCQEMLYDYATGTLDQDRRQAVEDFLPTDPECQHTLAAIKTGIRYTEELSRFQVGEHVSKRLREAESVASIGKKYSSWSQLPETLRWSALAIGACLALAVLVTVVPWSKLAHRTKSTDVVLTPLPTPASETVAVGDDATSDSEDSGSGDEGVEETSGDFHGKAAPLAAAVAPAPKATPLAVTVAQDIVDEKPEVESKKEFRPKGFVYRAFMSLSNIDDVADNITKQIEDLGGEKAGEVELGWKRGSGRYYHFSIPEDNQEKLLDALRAYGPVRISKDPHPRVMPQGQARFILWIDVAK